MVLCVGRGPLLGCVSVATFPVAHSLSRWYLSVFFIHSLLLFLTVSLYLAHRTVTCLSSGA